MSIDLSLSTVTEIGGVMPSKSKADESDRSTICVAEQITALLAKLRTSKFSGWWYTLDELVVLMGLNAEQKAWLEHKMKTAHGKPWIERCGLVKHGATAIGQESSSVKVVWYNILFSKQVFPRHDLEKQLLGRASARHQIVAPKITRSSKTTGSPAPAPAPAPAPSRKRNVASPPRGQVTVADGASPPGSARARSRGTSRGAKGRRGDDDGDDDDADDGDLAPPHLLRGAPPPCAADGNPMEISAVSVDGGGGFGASPTGVSDEEAGADSPEQSLDLEMQDPHATPGNPPPGGPGPSPPSLEEQVARATPEARRRIIERLIQSKLGFLFVSLPVFRKYGGSNFNFGMLSPTRFPK